MVLDIKKSSEVLEKLWKQVLSETDFEEDDEISKLINSEFVSIRYCLPTQILGKLVHPKLNALCLQKGTDDDPTKWDPRGFASKVIVPWISANQNILGTSPDPYVSKPLRKNMLESNPGNVKGAEDWKLLYKILNDIELRSNVEYTTEKFIATLRSIHKKYISFSFEYYFPERISLVQAINIVKEFLSESSGGDRGLSVAAAVFSILAKRTSMYKEIRRNKINASDASTGLSGDIECIGDNDEIILSVEVKEKKLTLNEVQSTIFKARKSSLREILFNAPSINPVEESKIEELFEKTWASGTNLYVLSIEELLNVGLALVGEDGRKEFLKEVSKQLDEYNTQPINRKRWKELLEAV